MPIKHTIACRVSASGNAETPALPAVLLGTPPVSP